MRFPWSSKLEHGLSRSLHLSSENKYAKHVSYARLTTET